MENERVSLVRPVVTSNYVEEWLTEVECSMKETLLSCLHTCLQVFHPLSLLIGNYLLIFFMSFKAFTDMERDIWVFSHPAQCTLVIEQVVWTHNVSTSLESIEVGQ